MLIALLVLCGIGFRAGPLTGLAWLLAGAGWPLALTAWAREQALAESEARFRILAEAVPSMLYEADATGGNTWANQTWLDYVERRAAEVAGIGWASSMHPDDLREVLPRWQESVRTGKEYVGHQRIRRAADGAWRWHLVRALPVRGADGRIRRWLGAVNDIHDLVEAQAALREQGEQLRLFVDRAPAAIAMFDTAMRYLAVSRRYLRDIAQDQPCDPQSLIGRCHYDAFPEHPARWRDIHRRVLAGETLSAEEDSFQRRDGRTEWVRWEMTPWHRADGTIGGAVVFAEVVTARKQAEAALRASEARLRLATEGANVGTWDVNLLTGEHHVSPEVPALHGRAPHEMTPQNWLEAVHPDDRAAAEAGWRRAMAEATTYEHVYRSAAPHPDGGERWLLGRGRVERDAAGVAVRDAGVLLDVTARVRAEAALRESEARFRAITDAMPQLVWSARPDGTRDYHNRRWQDATGLAPGPLTIETWCAMLHPDDRERVRMHWRHCLVTGEAFEQEYRLHRADGRHCWILGRALPVRDPQSGAITRWFGTCTDISDAVAAREALARSHAELERLVAERTAALTRAAEEREQAEKAMRQREKLAALGQLAGGIAHDFNNILQIISNCATLIARDARGRATGQDDIVGECIGMISDATGRGHGIVRRLLAFARRGELRAGPIDPAALLDDMRQVLTHTLASTVVLRFAVEPGLPVLLADRGQLEAALINLAVNARDAMPEGGTLTILAAVETVGPDAAPPLPLEPGAYVRFTLSDTGTGMDEATLARACEPFFTTKPRGGGTGLGLPMARGFAEQSGGALVIDSAPGQGCTVSLWLPAPGQEVEAAAPPPAAPARAGIAWRVLLVDDEPALLRSLAIGLRQAGFVVATAGDGPAALARLDAGEAVDVLVTDLLMPGISGMALIREAQARRRGLPAILLTGHVDDGVELAMQGAMSATFSLLGKPVGIPDLADRITTLLEARPGPGDRTGAAPPPGSQRA
ncbi:Histidine kinase [Rhodovastum atsumiense]|uniref:hybrid sensor histidine kinase/response regulator n=1 Tax=Rhodovastum atsumiense TaxID=504468 RepID=UPI002024FAC8|nr:PAS domain S-box protein [Rhodovastum atsumiense]CAH2602559.1 Histidine kinase [Rhodovastum atsumiense]